MAARLSDRELRQGLSDLSELAKKELREEIAQARTAQHARAILDRTMPALIDHYGAAAATLAADWYDEARERLQVAGSFRAIPADIPDTGSQSLLGWAIDQTNDLKVFETLTLGGYTRRIQQFGVKTITRSSIADPGAKGWQRTGLGSCSFCAMLIANGSVYSENAVDFAAHDHCNCSAVPAFGGQPKPVKPYKVSARRAIGPDGKPLPISAADRERVQAWIEANL